MRCSCTMMSPSDTSLLEEEGTDMDGAERDGVEWEGGAAESDCCDLNCALICLMVAGSMAHMTKNGQKREKEQKNGIKSV